MKKQTPNGKARYALRMTILVGLLGWLAFGVAFYRHDDARRWNSRLSRSTAIDAAYRTARHFGMTLAGCDEKVKFDFHRNWTALQDWAKLPSQRGLTPWRAWVRLQAPEGKCRLCVTVDAWGRPIAFAEEGGKVRTPLPALAEAPSQARAWLGRLVGEDEASNYANFTQEARKDGALRPDRLVLEAARSDRGMPPGWPITAQVVFDRSLGGQILLRAEPSAISPALIDLESGSRGRDAAKTVNRGLHKTPYFVMEACLFLAKFLLFLGLIGWAVRSRFRREFSWFHGMRFVLPCLVAGGLAFFAQGWPMPPAGSPPSELVGSIIEAGFEGAFFLFVAFLAWGAGRRISLQAQPNWGKTVDDFLQGKWGQRLVGQALLAGLASGGAMAFWLYLGPLTRLTPGVIVTNLAMDPASSSWPVLSLLANAVQKSFGSCLAVFAILVPCLSNRRSSGWRWLVGSLVGTIVFAPMLAAQSNGYLQGSAAGWAALLAGFASFAFLRWLWDHFGLLAVMAALFSSAMACSTAAFTTNSAEGFRGLVLAGCLLLGGLVLAAAGVAVWGRDSNAGESLVVFPERCGPDRLRLSGEMEAARLVQERLLAAPIPAAPGYEISVHCQPALQVGGDLHAVHPLPGGRVGLMVADVAGKGLPASLYMGLTKGVIMAEAKESADPLAILSAVNDNLWSLGNRKTFVTASLVVLAPETGAVEAVRAGHAPSMLLRTATSRVELLSPPGLGLGCAPPRTFDKATRAQVRHLEPGDILVLLSDGVTEAMNEQSEEYGLERLTALLERTGAASAEAVRDAILADLATFSGAAPQSDDVTLVVLRAQPKGPGLAPPGAEG